MAAAEKAEKIALLKGTATKALKEGIEDAGGKSKVVGVFDDLASAVHRLLADAQSGDVVLLSPGCASFGMFQNEFHRGETFMKIIEDIA